MYSELHKNDKSVNLSMHIFRFPNLTRFFILGTSQYTVIEVGIVHICIPLATSEICFSFFLLVIFMLGSLESGAKTLFAQSICNKISTRDLDISV